MVENQPGEERSLQRSPSARASTEVLAAALAGDRRRLQEALDSLRDPALRPRVPSLLASRAVSTRPAIEVPASLHQVRARTAAVWLLVEQVLTDLGRAFGAEGVPWAPFKGADLAATLYRDPADRPMTDVDVLVPEGDYGRARRALEASGWRDAVEGERFDRYVAEEGTAWTCVRPGFPLPIELHFRLWGFVPRGFGDELLERAGPDPSLGPTGRRFRSSDRFLLAAVHPFLHIPPRSLASWWEVLLLAEAGEAAFESEVVQAARRWQLQLPVVLAARRVRELWESPVCRALSERLEADLRFPERALLRWVRREAHRSDDVPTEALALARLLSRRPSRSGLRPLRRRFWAHPGIVERLTPAHWSWPRRRVTHLLQCLGILPAPRSDWWRAPTHGRRAP